MQDSPVGVRDSMSYDVLYVEIMQLIRYNSRLQFRIPGWRDDCSDLGSTADIPTRLWHGL